MGLVGFALLVGEDEGAVKDIIRGLQVSLHLSALCIFAVLIAGLSAVLISAKNSRIVLHHDCKAIMFEVFSLPIILIYFSWPSAAPTLVTRSPRQIWPTATYAESVL
jgi:hypothetical protein